MGQFTDDTERMAAQLEQLQTKQRELRAYRDTFTYERNKLARDDKQGAHELLQKIQSVNADLVALRPQIIELEGHVQRRRNHGMWCAVVRELFGEEGLQRALDRMRETRKGARKGEQHAA